MTRMDGELQAIRREVVRLGALVTDIVVNVARVAARMDSIAARAVIKEDQPIDDARFHLDDRLLQSLALHHPLGGDLRAIAAAMRVCMDLERIGDNAVNIAKAVLRINDDDHPWLHSAIVEMADVCVDMIDGAMAAYFSCDIDNARVISKRDDNVDAYYKEIEHFFSSQQEIGTAVSIQNVLIARAFERIGDHITNVCESVVFEITGLHEETN